MLVTEAKFELPTAGLVVPRVCDHLSEHATTLFRDGNAFIVKFVHGTGTLEIGEGTLSVRAEAEDLASLHSVRLALAAHIVEFAGTPRPRIIWTGDGADMTTPPNFRILRVVGVRQVTPRMRRIWFAGDDLGGFTKDDNLHVTLIFPPPGLAKPAWPTLGPDGLLKWPEGNEMPSLRKYTIRAHDAAMGTIAIDFVDHHHDGPGSGWARQALPGQQIGMSGPGGLGVRPADWYLLAGDETALPAIGRILESLPVTARGTALIEVTNAQEEQFIQTEAEIDVRWLHRGSAVPGGPSLLAEAVQTVQFPNDGSTIFAWAAGEFQTFKSIRAHLRSDRGLSRQQHLVVSYWRRGHSEDEA